MADKFAMLADAVSAPARRAFPITPHATAEIDPLPKAVKFWTAGVVTYRAVDSDADVVSEPVAAGERLDVRIKHIRSFTGTGITGFA